MLKLKSVVLRLAPKCHKYSFYSSNVLGKSYFTVNLLDIQTNRSFSSEKNVRLKKNQVNLKAYELLVKSNHFTRDEQQVGLVNALDTLAIAINKYIAKQQKREKDSLEKPTGRSQRKIVPPKGLYIHGSVGTGKTMLMDMFSENMNQKFSVKRLHYEELIDLIHKLRWSLDGSETGTNLLKSVAKEISKDCQILCIDELQMPDVASAILIKQVLSQVLEDGVVIVSTSNMSIDDLCTNGIHGSRIGNFKELLHQQMQEFELSGADYRAQAHSSSQSTTDQIRFLTPLTRESRRILMEQFEQLTKYNMVVEDALFSLPSERTLVVPKLGIKDKQRVALFSFDDLCVNKLDANDYAAIAREFGTVFITDIPTLNNKKIDHARRFISLIDQLYSHKVKVVCTSELPIDEMFQLDHVSEEEFNHQLELAEDRLNDKAETLKNTNAWMADMKSGLSLASLFAGGKAENFAAARTISRLHEMQSHSYWK